MLPYPFIGQFGQSTPWRIRGRKQMLGTATLVFRKQTTYDGQTRARIRFAFPVWYISAIGKA
jgi:hypothetical protein